MRKRSQHRKNRLIQKRTGSGISNALSALKELYSADPFADPTNAQEEIQQAFKLGKYQGNFFGKNITLYASNPLLNLIGPLIKFSGKYMPCLRINGEIWLQTKRKRGYWRSKQAAK